MAIFGESRDVSLFRSINRELLNRIIETKIGYYKIILDQTNSNIYGESSTKTFKDPVLINCLIQRSDQTTNTDEFGPDITRTDMQFRFFRDDLVDIQLVPEIGDIILWNENYYEVDGLVENQLVVGKYPEYAYDPTINNFGTSISILVNAHYTRPERFGLKIERL
jgi:hypothetical protein